LVSIAILAPPLNTCAQSPEHVAVIVNDNSPESQPIGQVHAAARSMPDANVFRTRTSTKEAISIALDRFLVVLLSNSGVISERPTARRRTLLDRVQRCRPFPCISQRNRHRSCAVAPADDERLQTS
jgi:hypothetical protein